MLTRHLYRIDEVKSSLLYDIVVQRNEEAFFWCLELFDTFCSEDILPLFLKAWMIGIGWKGFGFLSHFQDISEREEVDQDIFYQLLQTLLTYKERDASVYGLVLKGAQVKSQVDNVVPLELPTWIKEFSAHHQCLYRAIKQKKILLAWTLLRPLWCTEEILEYLERIAEPYQVKTFGILKTLSFFQKHTWEQRALFLLCLCSEKKAFQEIPLKEIPPSVSQKIEDWSTLEGKRSRRIFKIPVEAISWGTQRSFQPNTQTNMGDLLTILPSLQDSPYWEEVASTMGSWKHIRKVDELKEAFYDMYFPDDIPDEWSSKDREKSHGYGLLINGNKSIQQLKGCRNLIGRFPSLGLVSFTNDALSKYNWEWTSFEEAYSQPFEIVWNYEAKKKKIVIKK